MPSFFFIAAANYAVDAAGIPVVSVDSHWEALAAVKHYGHIIAILFVLRRRQGLQQKERERQSAEKGEDSADAKTSGETKKRSGKLSRLIRRRESKRDRNAPAAADHTVAAPTRKRAPTATGATATASPAQAVGSRVHNLSGNHNESSDNDSSTYYGQLRTFESVFEGSDQVRAAAKLITLTKKIHFFS